MVSSLVVVDRWFEELLFSIRTPFFLDVFNGITFFGNELTIAVIAAIVILFLLYFKVYRAYALGLAITLIGTGATGYALKALVGRARPNGLIPSVIETSFSFPSGHATAAIALYGFIAYILCVLFPTKKPVVVTSAILLIGSVGFSRLYLGVHFPSDVLAGYILGGLWILIGIAVAERFTRKETI